MISYNVKLPTGQTGKIRADHYDAKTGHFLYRGTVVHTVPEGAQVRVIETEEFLRPTAAR